MSIKKNKIAVYLDLNIYRHLIEKRKNWNLIQDKLNFLHKQGFIFPYSPAHMEEVALIYQKTDIDNHKEKIIKHLSIIERISKNYEYLPGIPTASEIDNVIMWHASENCSMSKELIQELEACKQEWRCGLLTEADRATRLTREAPERCFYRVCRDVDMSEFALKNDAKLVSRRTKSKAKSIFEELSIPYDESLSTLDEIRTKYGINPEGINDVPIHTFFQQPSIIKLAKDFYSLDINAIHKGIDFMKVHSYKEKIMEWLFNILEICGYKKDKQCDVIKIRSRMHDITHAIYGSSAKYFVTDDEKFSQRLRLIYHFLDLPIIIHDSKSFCSSNFQKKA